jgi:hypothetical protein
MFTLSSSWSCFASFFLTVDGELHLHQKNLNTLKTVDTQFSALGSQGEGGVYTAYL